MRGLLRALRFVLKITQVVDLLQRGGSSAAKVERRQVAAGIRMLESAVQSQLALPPPPSRLSNGVHTQGASYGSDSDSDWECGDCDRTFASERARDQHCRDTGHSPPGSEEDSDWGCCDCGRTFGSEQARDQHCWDTGHSPPSSSSARPRCPDCGREFGSAAALEQHCNALQHGRAAAELRRRAAGCVTAATCLNGHTLQRATGGGYFCDVCGAGCPSGGRLGCRRCDFDVCAACARSASCAGGHPLRPRAGCGAGWEAECPECAAKAAPRPGLAGGRGFVSVSATLAIGGPVSDAGETDRSWRASVRVEGPNADSGTVGDTVAAAAAAAAAAATDAGAARPASAAAIEGPMSEAGGQASPGGAVAAAALWKEMERMAAETAALREQVAALRKGQGQPQRPPRTAQDALDPSLLIRDSSSATLKDLDCSPSQLPSPSPPQQQQQQPTIQQQQPPPGRLAPSPLDAAHPPPAEEAGAASQEDLRRGPEPDLRRGPAPASAPVYKALLPDPIQAAIPDDDPPVSQGCCLWWWRAR